MGGEEPDGKGVINYWREGSGFLEIGVIKFTSLLLFDLLGIPQKCHPFIS